MQVILDIEGANTINRALLMGEFTSHLHESRKKMEIINMQTAKVNTDQTKDKVVASDSGEDFPEILFKKRIEIEIILSLTV